MEQVLIGSDDEAGVVALAACTSHIFPKALKAAIQLDLFEIIGGAHGDDLSPLEIASQLPTSNVDRTVVVLDSLLRLLVTHSLLTCSVRKLANGSIERRYGLAPAGRFFVGDENGASLAPYFAFVSREGPVQLSYKDAVLNGGKIFEKVHGKSYYGSMASDPESGKIFDNAMGAHSTMIMKKVVKIYDGFEGLSSLVNVGGGNGATLDIIASNYPSIRGINFDLPQVVQTAPSYKGIEHIGGDMFLQVPKGDAILLKYVLHNWGDEQCAKLLKNCYRALPNKGKLIVMDYILPNSPQTDVHAKYASQMDIVMAAMLEGKERTEDEFRAMAKDAGFAEFKVVCYVYGVWIMEFFKLV
ncbi:caffeic acid 3-o-methyltransferase [Phtheirospermum japonicum]|uniref:Caffeic acid 3-o-methyltransferase n=1 Tax=Phtheirospermum japonicum TaxID=374723 RepID=A0A830CK42_9LAMI|nr:caffeic acid 3-o-methyltransferase [Phtheirospermum japonicum]